MHKTMNPLLLIGMIGVFVFGAHLLTQLARSFWEDQNIWWTPKQMALSLDQSRQHFELYVRDTLLQEHCERNTLLALDAEGNPHPVQAGDIAVRVNNWNSVNASFLRAAIPTTFLSGVSLTCFILGIGQMIMDKKRRRMEDKAHQD